MDRMTSWMPVMVFSFVPSRFQIVIRLLLKRVEREMPQRSSSVFG